MMQFFKTHYRWITLPPVLLILLSGFFFSARTETTAQKDLAFVNGSPITQNDLDREFSRVKMQAADQGRPIDAASAPAVQAKILESLINREVLYQQASAKGITVEASEVESDMEKIKQRFSMGRSFGEALDEMKISEKAFKDEIAKAIMIQKLLDAEVYQKITVSDKEARIFYDNNPQFFLKPEQVKASHILIQVAAQADEEQRKEARKRIEDIQLKLQQGEDFAELAKKFSECPSGKNGGDLGVFDRKKMVKPFSDAAFALKPGEISGIVETQFGYHIIKVFEKTPQTKLAYIDIRERLIETMRHQKIQKETIAYIEQLKKTADIRRISP